MNQSFEKATLERWNIFLDLTAKHTNTNRSKLLKEPKILLIKKNFFNKSSKEQAEYICRSIEMLATLKKL